PPSTAARPTACACRGRSASGSSPSRSPPTTSGCPARSSPRGDRMRYGLTLSSEEHTPRRLLEIAELAERSGFDFVSISDHYHPWIDAQGHSPFVWTMLGALAERTQLDVVVGVTCPIMRIHPVINAHAVATTSQLLG